MPKHAWQVWEMLETLRIAALPRAQWDAEIQALTDKIRRCSDPNMDEHRVRVAVHAAYNLIQGRPDDYPKASKQLRDLYWNKGPAPGTQPRVSAPVVRRRQQPAVATDERRGWAPSEEERARLLSFEGYGVDEPDIVFVGIEEYCDADPRLQRENIRRRCTANAYRGVRVDKDEALRCLEGVVRTTTVPVWNMSAKLVASLTGRPWETELAALGARPAHHRPSTLLTEVYPLPRPGTDHPWKGSYLEEWFAGEFRSRSDYEKKSKVVAGQRLRGLLEMRSAPRIVFFYGVDVGRWAKDCLASLVDGAWKGEREAIARTKNGTLLVATGFYDGQHAATKFREQDIEPLAQRIDAMIGGEIRALVNG